MQCKHLLALHVLLSRERAVRARRRAWPDVPCSAAAAAAITVQKQCRPPCHLRLCSCALERAVENCLWRLPSRVRLLSILLQTAAASSGPLPCAAWCCRLLPECCTAAHLDCLDGIFHLEQAPLRTAKQNTAAEQSGKLRAEAGRQRHPAETGE